MLLKVLETEVIIKRINHRFEKNQCFRYNYREYYVPGNSMSPGYVKSYKEKVSVPCNGNSLSNDYIYQPTENFIYKL